MRAAFGSWVLVLTDAVPVTALIRPAGPTTIYLLDRPTFQQTLIYAGTLGPDRSSSDFAALEMMAPILGATPASRLQQNLR